MKNEALDALIERIKTLNTMTGEGMKMDQEPSLAWILQEIDDVVSAAEILTGETL